MLRDKSHLEKARELLALGDRASLRYCALELRTSIELLCYDRLSMYVDEISPEFLKKWRPSEIVELLLECSPDSDQDCTIALAKDGEMPTSALGSSKGITKKFIRSHYHRLGGYLHAPTLADQQAGREQSLEAIRASLQATLAELDLYAKSRAMSNFGVFLTFSCAFCDISYKRNNAALVEGQQVKCLNPECPAEFIVRNVQSQTPLIEPVQIPWDCAGCKEIAFLLPGEVKLGTKLECAKCLAVYRIVYSLRPLVEEKTA